MTARNINYFGTFLDTMNGRSRSGSASGPKTASFSGSRRNVDRDWGRAQMTSSPDPLNEIVKALFEKDGLGAKELVPLTGLSLSNFMEASKKLDALGLVDVSKPFILHLTAQGRELAEVLFKAPPQVEGEP